MTMIRARRLLIALITLSVLGCTVYFEPASSGASGYPDKVAERISRVEGGLLPPVTIKGKPVARMRLVDRMQHHQTPGVSIAVINDGKIEWARGYGIREAGLNDPVTEETMFQAASISKPVAAMGALLLVEKGVLGLDEDVNQKLKSWRIPDNWRSSLGDTSNKSVTLRGLVTHSAGLTVHGFRGYAEAEDVPSLVQVLGGQKPANSAAVRVDLVPGTRWRYSGGGYSVMQQLIIDVTRKPFPEFMQEAVLRPLGMKNSAYLQPLPEDLRVRAATGHRGNGKPIKGRWHTYPEMAAAGLWTTPSDLARFAVELQNSRSGKSNRILTKDMAVQMTTRQFEGWGLGFSIAGSGDSARFSHGGSNEGFKCILIAYADNGRGAVIMTNGDNGSALASELLRSIAREYEWPGSDYQSREREIATVDRAIFKTFVGRYEISSGMVATVTSEGGRLFVQAPPLGEERVELHPESELTWFVTVTDLTITFVRDASGAVTEMLVQPPGQSFKARKTE